MKRLVPLILALLFMAGDGRFKCWYSGWYMRPDTGDHDLSGGSFTDVEAEARVGGSLAHA